MAEETYSPREKEVIELLLQGKSNKQMALTLHVANHTVEFHLSNIYAKMGITSRTQAVLKLSETGLRESTAVIDLGNVQESAVEKKYKAADNGSKSFSLRSKPMKNLLYVICAILVITTLIVVISILAIHAKQADPTPPLPAETEMVIPASPTGTAIPTAKAEPTSATPPGLSTNDVAQFVSETYPDWTNIPAGTTFTKAWTFRSAGTTTWTTGYFLKLTTASYPLG